MRTGAREKGEKEWRKGEVPEDVGELPGNTDGRGEEVQIFPVMINDY